MPTTEECNRIISAIKELGGSATTVKIAARLSMTTKITSYYIQSMRRFGMLQAKCGLGTGKGLLYELKDAVRA